MSLNLKEGGGRNNELDNERREALETERQNSLSLQGTYYEEGMVL